MRYLAEARSRISRGLPEVWLARQAIRRVAAIYVISLGEIMHTQIPLPHKDAASAAMQRHGDLHLPGGSGKYCSRGCATPLEIVSRSDRLWGGVFCCANNGGMRPGSAGANGQENRAKRSKITKTRAAGAVKLRGVLFFANGIDKSRAA